MEIDSLIPKSLKFGMGKFCVILLLLSLGSYAHAEDKYNLQDLEILTQEESYEEFFKHALDIRPSERQDIWKALVTKMGDRLSKKILSGPEITHDHFKLVEKLYTWPVLKSDDLFTSRRQEIGLSYLKKCLKAPEEICWGDFKSFWMANREDPETAFKLAELSSKHKDSPIPQWDFLQVAVKSPLSEFFCQKESTLVAVWEKLTLDYIRLGIKGDFLKKIDETMHPECLKHLNAKALQQLSRPDGSADRELAFQILHAQGKMNQDGEDFFYAVYLLENPSKGDLFNISWNRISLLAKDASRREKVLAKLITLDPLPDELFSSLDLSKKKAILNHFKLSFPEYLTHYVQQCLSYYEGKAKFPNGNPTIHCQDLMNSELSNLFVNEEQVKAFHKARSI